MLITEDALTSKAKGETKAYENVSLIYQELMKDINYPEWEKYIRNISSEFVQKDANVLELGAGNCKIANLLSKKFPEIILIIYKKATFCFFKKAR